MVDNQEEHSNHRYMQGKQEEEIAQLREEVARAEARADMKRAHLGRLNKEVDEEHILVTKLNTRLQALGATRKEDVPVWKKWLKKLLRQR